VSGFDLYDTAQHWAGLGLGDDGEGGGKAVEITTPRGQARWMDQIESNVSERRELGSVGVGLVRFLTRR
jgi:hypothetical protein